MKNPNIPENTFRIKSEEESTEEPILEQEAAPEPPAVDDTLAFSWSYEKLLGGALMLTALLLAVALLSFLFTGPADQSLVGSLFEITLTDSAQEVQNWLGLFGAFFAHILAYKLFGVAAFLWLPLLFELGKGFYFEQKSSPYLSKQLARTLGMSVWLSAACSWLIFLINKDSFLSFYCGGIGWGLMQFLHGLLGIIGTPLLLAGVAYAYWHFARPNWLQSKEQKLDEQPEKSTFKQTTDKSATTSREPISQRHAEDDTVTNNANDIADDASTQETLIRKVGTYHEYEVGQHKEHSEGKAQSKEDKVLDKDLEAILEIDSDRKKKRKDNSIAQPANDHEKTEVYETIEDLTEKKTVSNNEVGKDTAPDENPDTLFPTHLSPAEEAEKQRKTALQKAAQLRKSTEYIMPVEALLAFELPNLTLLKDVVAKVDPVDIRELEDNKANIVRTLQNFKVLLEDIKATVGPTVTLYELWPAQGVKISQIRNLEDDIALNLKALGIRIIAPMPGKGTIGLEVPNKKREMVTLKELLESPKFKDSKKELPIALGKNISNEIIVTDLTKMPHLLIAGATGQGKSVGINVLIASLLYKKHPGELKFVLIDPKKVEFSLYNKLEKHYLAKLPSRAEAVVTDAADAVQTLNALVTEMNERYDLLKSADCRQITEYNAKIAQEKLDLSKGHRFLPYIVVVIDELADLMITISKDIEKPIARLAQMARAIGIHLVVATQRPSVNVITGVIKANFPARMAFRVSSKVDSRVILDVNGADQLVGQGDMLLSNGSDIMRLQCAFIDTQEVEGLCDYINTQNGYTSAYPLPDSPEAAS